MFSNKISKAIEKYLDRDIVSLLEEVDAHLAGGAILSIIQGDTPKDWDIYIPSVSKWAGTLLYLLEGEAGYCQLVHVSDRAFTFYKNDQVLQVILVQDRGMPSIHEDIFESFDFTTCMAAYRFQDGEFFSHPDFLDDTLEKKLVVNPKTAYPICSLLRVKKYEEKGYKISKMELVKLALAINFLGILTEEEILEQLGGFYGGQAIKLGEGDDVFQKLDRAREVDISGVDNKIEENIKDHKLLPHLARNWMLTKLCTGYSPLKKPFDVLEYANELIEGTLDV